MGLTTNLVPEPSGRYLRTLLGVDLTDEQLAVATHPLTPQLVVAGAGSGKTAVMAARVVHLVAHEQVLPAEVLGLTFTNKAAAELAERVRGSVRRLARAGLLPDDDDLPTVSTYHAYAASVVRDHALRIGREPNLQLLTEATQWQLAMRAVRRARGPVRHLDWQPSTMARRLLSLAGELAEHLVPVQAVRQYDARLIEQVEGLAQPVAEVRSCAAAARGREELLDLVEAYRQLKVDLDLMDFGDQVALAAEIAAAPDVAALERARFRAVVLDEYQDTGVAQRLLLQRLYGGDHPVTAVGDPNQAIYGWRGASIGNLIHFHDHFAADPTAAAGRRPQPLMTSFRCGGRILGVANEIAAPLATRAAERGRRVLEVRPLSSVPARADDGTVTLALHADAESEARWVAAQVAAAGSAGRPWSEIAVLCRRRSDFAALARTLGEAGVPAEVVGLGGLLQLPEVADVVAVLRLLVDPVANAALVRLLTGARWRIGPRDLAALGRRAKWLVRDTTIADEDRAAASPLEKATESVDPVDVVSLLDALQSPGDPAAYSPEALARFRAFTAELDAIRPLVSQPVVEVVASVIRATGLGVEVESDTPALATARVANLAALLDHAASFTGLEGETDLRAFVTFLEVAADEEDGLDVGGVSTADTVKLLTVHKAKGLEWDVVLLPGVTKDVWPTRTPRSRWTRAPAVLPYSLRGDAPDLPRDPTLDSAGLKSFKADCGADDDDEERRLLYVALTRAREAVLVSGSWWTGTRKTPAGPSPFLEELRGVSGVVEDVWVTEEERPATNPLLAAARADVRWPRPLAADVLNRRRHAAAAVTAAMAAPRDLPLLEPTEADVVARWAQEAELLLDELRRNRSTERVVPLPRRLTASQVVALAADPDDLARRLARPMPAAPVRQARRGTRFHAWVEALFAEDRPLLEPDDLPGAGDEELSDAELAELQQRFLAGEWGARRPVAVEAPFELVVAGRLLRGRIDAVYSGVDGGFDVVDYKTGAVPRDFAAASLQLSVYRLAWAGLAGVDPDAVDAGFLYVRTGELKRPERLLSADELAALIAG